MKKNNKVRADGRICVQVYTGMVDGKRTYKSVYGDTQKKADSKADDLKREKEKGNETFHSMYVTLYVYINSPPFELVIIDL